jgi:hypothetical protein
MEDDINEILATKRAWQKGDQDRRKKDGSARDRKLSADIKNIERTHSRNVRKIDRELEREAFVLAACILVALAILIFWPHKAHAEDINLDKIAEIESNNNPQAFNEDANAIGMYQITYPVLSDFNAMHPLDWRYNMSDMYNAQDSWGVANWYLNSEIPNYLIGYGIEDTIRNRLIAWNWGIGHLRKWYHQGHHWNKLPLETRRYIIKYERGI